MTVNTSTIAPVSPPAAGNYVGFGYSVYVPTTDRIWQSANSDVAFDYGATVASGNFAILDPSDMSIDGWSFSESSGSLALTVSVVRYDSTDDLVWASGYNNNSGLRLLKYASDGELLSDFAMPTDCVEYFAVSPINGTVYVRKQDWGDGGRMRWLYTLNKSTGALDSLVWDATTGYIEQTFFDGSGNLLMQLSDGADGDLVRISADHSTRDTIWSTTGDLSVYRIAVDTSRNYALLYADGYALDGHTSGVLWIDLDTLDVLSWTGTDENWVTHEYDPIRDLFFVSVALPSPYTSPANGVTEAKLVALKGSDLTEYASVYHLYDGPEVDMSAYLDELSDVCDSDSFHEFPIIERAGSRIYSVGTWFGWDDATSTLYEFRYWLLIDFIEAALRRRVNVFVN